MINKLLFGAFLVTTSFVSLSSAQAMEEFEENKKFSPQVHTPPESIHVKVGALNIASQKGFLILGGKKYFVESVKCEDLPEDENLLLEGKPRSPDTYIFKDANDETGMEKFFIKLTPFPVNITFNNNRTELYISKTDFIDRCSSPRLWTNEGIFSIKHFSGNANLLPERLGFFSKGDIKVIAFKTIYSEYAFVHYPTYKQTSEGVNDFNNPIEGDKITCNLEFISRFY